MTRENSQSDKKKGNKISQITSLVVTAIWMTALFTGQGWWLPALLIGYIVVVPLTSLLWGAEDEQDDDDQSSSHQESSRPKHDALELLRERYAYGELTESQFERKVEVLLDTESMEDAEEWVLDTSAVRDAVETDEAEEQQISREFPESKDSSK